MDMAILLTVTIFFTYLAGVVMFKPLLDKLEEEGFVGYDMYKKDKPPVPEMGGIGIAFSFLVGILFIGTLYEIPYEGYLIVFVLALYFIFGLVDDILGVSGGENLGYDKFFKVIIPLFFVFPLINHVDTHIDLCFFGNYELGLFYSFLFIPIFVMVCANLVNMFSYYNGQSAATTLIIVVFVVVKLYTVGRYDLLYILFPFIGAVLAFLSYNIQPAGVFPGDSGDMFMGAIIGIAGVVGKLEIFVFIALLPLTINFLMFACWFIQEKGDVKVKFGGVREDGTIKPPNPKTLMWMFPYYFKLTERQTNYIMIGLVFISSISAWMIC
ncbi:MAG: hypothetical protein ACQESD_02745 [Thermoplasmatota archaeon]